MLSGSINNNKKNHSSKNGQVQGLNWWVKKQPNKNLWNEEWLEAFAQCFILASWNEVVLFSKLNRPRFFFLREHFTALCRWFKVAIDKFSAFKLVPYELHFHSVALSATECEIYPGKWRLNLEHKIIWLQSVPERLITRASCWFSHEQVPATTVVFHFCVQKNKNMTPTFLKAFLSACRLHKMHPSAMLLEVAQLRKQERDPVSRSTSPTTRSIALFTYTATV